MLLANSACCSLSPNKQLRVQLQLYPRVINCRRPPPPRSTKHNAYMPCLLSSCLCVCVCVRVSRWTGPANRRPVRGSHRFMLTTNTVLFYLSECMWGQGPKAKSSHSFSFFFLCILPSLHPLHLPFILPHPPSLLPSVPSSFSPSPPLLPPPSFDNG